MTYVNLKSGTVSGRKLHDCRIELFKLQNLLKSNNIELSVFCKTFNLNCGSFYKKLKGYREKSRIELINIINYSLTREGLTTLKIGNSIYGRTGKWKKLNYNNKTWENH